MQLFLFYLLIYFIIFYLYFLFIYLTKCEIYICDESSNINLTVNRVIVY